MARKAKKSTENIATAVAPAVDLSSKREQSRSSLQAMPSAAESGRSQTTAPVTPKLIVAKRSYDRWYVYFKGVLPKDNPACACKTAKSAIRYMHLLKARYGATISQNIYERLQFEAQREG